MGIDRLLLNTGIHMKTSKIIKCAKGWKSWGRLPARQFAINNQIDIRLIILARQLEAIKGFN